jgi:acetylglutamate kinase
VASLAPGPKGEYFNINADDFAAALAQELKADRLVYLTESGGVWDADQRLLPLVKVGEIGRLIRRGVVRDGMIPKLRSCARTLARQVKEIDLLPPAVPGALLEAVRAGNQIGTRIVK